MIFAFHHFFNVAVVFERPPKRKSVVGSSFDVVFQVFDVFVWILFLLDLEKQLAEEVVSVFRHLFIQNVEIWS